MSDQTRIPYALETRTLRGGERIYLAGTQPVPTDPDETSHLALYWAQATDGRWLLVMRTPLDDHAALPQGLDALLSWLTELGADRPAPRIVCMYLGIQRVRQAVEYIRTDPSAPPDVKSGPEAAAAQAWALRQAARARRHIEQLCEWLSDMPGAPTLPDDD